MELQLKQRLVGLTVIFSLAVIFLPMLLDGSGLAPRHVEFEIPTPPTVQSEVRVEEKIIELDRKTEQLARLDPVIVDEISDPPAAIVPSQEAVTAETVEPNRPTEAAEQVEKPKQAAEQPEAVAALSVEQKKPVAPDAADNAMRATEESVPRTGGISWVIQTGSFQEKDKAYRQRDRLRQSKLAPVFIEKYPNNGKLNYRVRMGPFLTRDKANVIRNKVRAKYNIKAILMKYEK